MTTTTNTPPLIEVPALPSARRFRSPRVRFALAFLMGLGAALALGAGVLFAFERQYEGRILPGISVGGVDLSGLTPAAARDRLSEAFDVSTGSLVLSAAGRDVEIAYEDLDRRIDVETLVADAQAVGRSGSFVDRFVGNARTALRGFDLAPRVLLDDAELAERVREAASRAQRTASSAAVIVTKADFTLRPGSEGRTADAETALQQASTELHRLDAPKRLTVTIPTAAVEPRITTAEATTAIDAAKLMARDIDVTVGDEVWTIKASTVRTWIRMRPTVDGGLVALLQVMAPRETLVRIGEKVHQDPKNASFLVGKDNSVVGVTAGRDGRRLDIEATRLALLDALHARAASQPTAAIAASVKTVRPTLTTEEAEQAAPLMARISTWTTYFPISIKNGYGANIWIPSTLIDGYVVAPGERFDFWKAVGPVTSARGFRPGGAIINGRTEPQGALAGGICSCSTTLFNAALRAGLEMGARRNHYYYIDRYPLGLDATVFISGSSVQTMSFTNDTKYPILIRGINSRDGGAGYVRFDLYSVPTGRTISFTKPIVKNVRNATDTVQYTSTLPAGQRQRVEFPVQGKDVWVTRIVKDKNGRVVHQDTYYSHYARITGIVLVGTGGGDTTGEGGGG
jgi:vancomycin resistance protein YoaR